MHQQALAATAVSDHHQPEPDEVWIPVVRHPGYEVSNRGRVRSLDRTIIDSNGVPSRRKGRILKPFKMRGTSPNSDKWYKYVCLYACGEAVNMRLHRIVAEAWIPNPHNKPFVNHIDGNKANNQAENLEWVTNQENVDHANRLGLLEPAKAALRAASRRRSEAAALRQQSIQNA